MKTLERITNWIVKNLEQPFYQAEVTRAEVMLGSDRRQSKRVLRGMIHSKLALRVTK